jgi:hypothetical protein
VVGHNGGLRKTLGFVVYGAEADGVYVAPIRLDLWVYLWISVTLRGGGVEITGTVFTSDIEGIKSSSRTYEKGLDAKTGVVNGTGRRGEVEDEVDFARVKGVADVLLDEAEAGLPYEMAEVHRISSAEIIDTNDRASISK